MNNPFLILAVFATILAGAYRLVAQTRRWLLARAILDIPNQRSAHEIPTPRGGGLPLVALVVFTALVVTLLTQNWLQGLVYCGSALLIAGLGWMDDVFTLSARLRFGIQGLVAFGCVMSLGYFHVIDIPLLGRWEFGWLGFPLTILWIVGLTNAFNFMDGIDGITGAVSTAAGLSWVALAMFATGSEFGFWLALAVTAACLGFLAHNWHPARIFMGDVGSTFFGFTFAVLPLFSHDMGGDSLLIGTAIVWIYIFDAGLTFLRRLLKGEHVFSAHRTHLYQRLTISGLAVPTVSLLYGLLTLAGGVLALGWLLRLPWVPAFLLPGMPLAWFVLYLYTRYVRKA